jgi:hypothetical protein
MQKKHKKEVRLLWHASFESKDKLAAMWLLLLPIATALPVASKTTTGPDEDASQPACSIGHSYAALVPERRPWGKAVPCDQRPRRGPRCAVDGGEIW